MINFPIPTYVNGMLMATYLLVTLVMGLELVFNVCHDSRYRKSLFVQLLGSMFLVETFSTLVGGLLNVIWPSIVFDIVVKFCDITVVVLLILAGFALTSRKCLPCRFLTFVTLPPLVVFIIALFVNNSLYWATLLIEVYFVIMVVILLVHLYRHENTLKDYYSNMDNRHIMWFAFFSLWCVIEFPMYYLLNVRHVYGDMGERLFYVFLLVFYFVLFELALRQHVGERKKEVEKENEDEIEVDADETTNDDETTSATLTDEQLNEIAQQLDRLMKEDRIYLDADLNTNQLARAIHSNTKYLYYYLRDVLHLRFYEYINSFRIEDAKQLMLETDEKTESIALSVGFKSYNTFAKAFRKTVGVSPNIWRNEKKNIGDDEKGEV